MPPAAAGAAAGAPRARTAPKVDPGEQQLRRESRRANRAQRAAYERGRRGDAPTEGLAYPDDPELQRLYEEGAAGGQTRQVGRAQEGQGEARIPSIDEPAGFVLGLLAYALVLAYIRGGWAGTASWLSAKFTNKPTQTTAVAPLTPIGPQGAASTPAAWPTGPTGPDFSRPTAPAASATAIFERSA